MALKDTWVNKVDGVDISSANDINEVAQAVIDLENESGSRPDFAANEGEKGFIKNRTHYIDKDGKVHALPIEFIPEGVAKEKYVDDSLKALFVPRRLSEMVSDKYHRTVEDDEKEKWNDGIIEQWEITENYTASSNIVIAQQSLSSGIWMNRKYDIEPGMTYAVYIGGKEYFCIAGNEDGTIYLGNPKLFDSASTQAHNNEPFCITWAGGSATAGMFFKDSTLSYPLTLKVTGAAVTTEKKLPVSYLPDDVAMKSDIPEGGGGANIDVVASVGQTIVVEEVDADGKPTKWKAAGYQERTHWSDFIEVQPSTTITPVYFEALGVPIGNMSNFDIVVGNKYKVTFDGVEYICEAFIASTAGMSAPAFGNTAVAGGANTGEPFAIFKMAGDELATVIFFDMNPHTVQVFAETVTPIPQKYLENALPYIYEVPFDSFKENDGKYIAIISEIPLALLDAMYFQMPICLKVTQVLGSATKKLIAPAQYGGIIDVARSLVDRTLDVIPVEGNLASCDIRLSAHIAVSLNSFAPFYVRFASNSD